MAAAGGGDGERRDGGAVPETGAVPGTGAVPETGVHTKGTVGTGTEPGLGRLGWGAVGQPAEEQGWEGMSALRWAQ